MTEPLPLGPEETCPYVSVILPVRNEQASIHSCLSAVLEQDYPSTRMEVIVADGMSTDGTRDIVRSLQSTYANLCCIDNPGRIVATGLNAAIRLSKGHIVVRVDGHSIIEPDYVRSCVAELDRSGADNVGGRMCASGGSRFGRVVAVATSTAFGVGGARFHYSNQEEWVDTVYMGAWRREVFARVGLFDEELVRDQDDEFNYRSARAPGKDPAQPAYPISVHRSGESTLAVAAVLPVRILENSRDAEASVPDAPPAIRAAVVCGLLDRSSGVGPICGHRSCPAGRHLWRLYCGQSGCFACGCEPSRMAACVDVAARVRYSAPELRTGFHVRSAQVLEPLG